MRQNLLQSVSNITKCDKNLLQSLNSITKCDNYYKVRRNTSINQRGKNFTVTLNKGGYLPFT